MRRFLVTIALATLASIVPAWAQMTSPPAVAISPARELVIGTKEAPPFSMKAPDGSWEGISIELWRRVAREHDLRYRFAEESNVQDLLYGVAAGQYDVVVAAMTPTAAREQTVDFTQPFYASGLGIAIPVAGLAGWLPVVRAMTLSASCRLSWRSRRAGLWRDFWSGYSREGLTRISAAA